MTSIQGLRAFIETHTPRHHGVPRVVSWCTSLPNGQTTGGFGVCWPDRNADRRLMLCDIEPLHSPNVRAEQCMYIVDDGATSLPYCVSRWCLHEGSSACVPWMAGGYLMLRRQHPRPVDAAHQPRRAWHLVIRTVEEVS